MVDVFDSVISRIENLVSSIRERIISSIQSAISSTERTITSALSSISQALQSSIARVQSAVESIPRAISDLIEKIQDLVETVVERIVDRLGDVFEDLIDAFRSAVSRIVDGIRNIVEEVGDLARRIADSVKDAIGDLARRIGDFVSNLIQAFKERVSDLIDRIKDFAQRLVEGILHAAQELWTHIQETLRSVRDRISAILSQILDYINDYVARFRKFILDQFTKITNWWNKEVLPRIRQVEPFLKELSNVLNQALDLVFKGDFVGALKLLDQFFNRYGIPSPLDFIYGIAYFWHWLYFQIELTFTQARYIAQRTAEIQSAMNPAPLGDIAEAVARGFVSEGELSENLRLAGIDPGRAKGMVDIRKAYPSPGAVQEAFLRGVINEEEHDRLLKHMGYTDESIKLFKAIYFALPTISDLVRMSVREVFTPEIAERFGQYEDLPEVFVHWAKKVGLSEEWAKAYWAAHWDLPSPTQGFEMLHRGIITEEELKLLLRALDVMPFWREKLIQLSYNPLTRVDIRRMYKLGVLDENGVYRAYLDLGYKPEHAQQLTEFTKRYSAPEDEDESDQFRSLARTIYSRAYRKRVISVDEYRQFLKSMRYADEDINLLVALDDAELAMNAKLFDVDDYRKEYFKLVNVAFDRGLINENEYRTVLSDLGLTAQEIDLNIANSYYARQLSLRNLITDRLHDLYVEYTIDEEKLSQLLGMFNFSYPEIERLTQEWNIERGLRTRKPSFSDFHRFWKSGLITGEEFLNELRGLGYHERYVRLFANFYQIPYLEAV